MSEPEEKVVVGKISGAYGIKGWVKVYSYTDPLDQIFDYAPWVLKHGSRKQSLKISQSRKHGKGLVVLFDGFDDRNQAEAITGSEILVEKRLFSELEDGDFYWFQLEGLKVFNEADELLGKVTHMIETGANDVLSLVSCEGSIDDKERLIPYVENKVVTGINLEEGRINVIWQSDF